MLENDKSEPLLQQQTVLEPETKIVFEYNSDESAPKFHRATTNFEDYKSDDD